MFRLLFMTFFTGEYRGDHEPHAGSARTMAIPTVILAVLSTIGGWLVLPGHDEISRALQGAFQDRGVLPALGVLNWFVTGLATTTAVAGIFAAYWLYERAPELRASGRTALSPLRSLLANAYYADTVYHWLFEVPTLTLASDVAKYVDPEGVGGFTAGLARATTGIGDAMRGWETGYLRRYGLTMVIGMVLVLAYYVFVVRGSPGGMN
jgi:NADH-quinone oxidoreductase subunit L